MRPQRRERAPRNPPRADLVGTGFASVLSAASFLTLATVGGGDGDGDGPPPGPFVHGDGRFRLVLAFALLAAGLLSIMHGMRTRAPPSVRPALLRAGSP
ncbi:hypothetical protein GUJ93_ZPchr0068g2951 [Zizania palustris]|uniref:Uncharacterized protein n=1 Tax=Zizania palustris TaxID=103762 RepID=A0A8J5RTF1_ZIZPA|nr:hypothetical protein GUJ93_ZPchr0068g2951 [Zizania palustris]